MRKGRAKKRILLPDPKFGNTLITRFVNNLMLDGRKNTAYQIFYDAMDIISTKVTEEEAVAVWEKALENIMPAVEVRSRRIGGATFQIPQPVRDDRKISLGMKWMIGITRKRNEKTMREKIANEIIEAHNNKGNAVKKREETHKMAEANRAFSHFRW